MRLFWEQVIVGKYGQEEGSWCSKEVREGYEEGVWRIKGGWRLSRVEQVLR